MTSVRSLRCIVTTKSLPPPRSFLSAEHSQFASHIRHNRYSSTHFQSTERYHHSSRWIRNTSRALTRPQLSSRPFSTSQSLAHGHLGKARAGEERKVTFIDKDGHENEFTVADGDNLLDIAQANDLEMEGACGGSCACSTCHIIVQSEDYYNRMPEPDDDENDMLDLAFGLTETSRLGCQVKMTKELDGVVVRLPSMTRNLQASDFMDKKKGD